MRINAYPQVLTEDNIMYIKDWKKDLFTIPNLLSLFRLMLIPVYVMIYLKANEPRDYVLAGSILAVSCMTDMIDGQIARHFNMVSSVGKILDPVADKMTQLALIISLSVKYPFLQLNLLLFLIKEIFQTMTMIIMYFRGKVLPGAIPEGKICTIVLFLSFILLVLLPDLNLKIAHAIAAADAAVLAYAFIGYFLAYFGKHPKLLDLQE